MRKIFQNFILFFLSIIIFSCSQSPPPAHPYSKPSTKPSRTFNKSKSEAQRFLGITQLGYNVINNQNFSKFLGQLDNKNHFFIAKIDMLPIGQQIGGLDQWDIAFENGLVKGLLSGGFSIDEKLDHIKIRDMGEYINTEPKQGFYMHAIDLESHNTIKNQYNSSYLLEYQVFEFSAENESVIVYLRIVDINTLKIIASTLIKEGLKYYDLETKNIQAYDEIYNSIISSDLPLGLLKKLKKATVLDIDILNVSGQYKNPPREKLLLVENAIISSFLDHNDYRDKNILIEKTTGFNLKYPNVYDHIVFNTNPILFEEWSEFVEQTNCTELIMYRFVEDEGIYFRVIDAKNNGEILASFFVKLIPQKRFVKETLVYNLFMDVENEISKSLDYKKLRDKRVMLIDGDKHPIESEAYVETRKRYDEMQFAIEEGILASLLSDRDIKPIEKLKTLYLKQPWMYEGKVFNLNPLYLEDWSQLQTFGVDVIILYNNLIPYHNLNKDSNEYYEIAVTYKIIDLNTGDIVQVGEISN
jgi:hypothetical protein